MAASKLATVAAAAAIEAEQQAFGPLFGSDFKLKLIGSNTQSTHSLMVISNKGQ